MPLMLNTPETERPKRFVWDPNSYTDSVEAAQGYRSLMAQGWTCKGEFQEACASGEVVLYPPQKDPHLGVMRVLDKNGDSRIVWDRRDAKQVKEAFEKFKDFRSKGYRAYVVRSDGTRGSRLDEFDPLLEEILVGKRPEEIVMVPATVPG